jgi:4-aminobutyrate aminotransferase-like enzyme
MVKVDQGGHFVHIFRIKPPICIAMEDADFAADILEDAIRNEL